MWAALRSSRRRRWGCCETFLSASNWFIRYPKIYYLWQSLRPGPTRDHASLFRLLDGASISNTPRSATATDPSFSCSRCGYHLRGEKRVLFRIVVIKILHGNRPRRNSFLHIEQMFINTRAQKRWRRESLRRWGPMNTHHFIRPSVPA